MTARLAGIWDALLNLVYPPVCQICQRERAGIEQGYVGGECWSQVRFVAAPFCHRCGLPYEGTITQPFVCSNCADIKFHFCFARSAVIANPLVLQVIHRYKYNHALYFESFLADLLIRQAVPALKDEKWDLIVPVPLHPAKEREREFNQAGRLARHLSRATRIPVNTELIRRVKPTQTQTQLNRAERAGNVQGAFVPRGGKKLNGERIILLDDVLTTGATTSACARILRKAGAGDVCVWTVARGA
ncbi:MAG: ComF family protein [Verrucomicrobiota bacterium]|jgi:ComF family protein